MQRHPSIEAFRLATARNSRSITVALCSALVAGGCASSPPREPESPPPPTAPLVEVRHSSVNEPEIASAPIEAAAPASRPKQQPGPVEPWAKALVDAADRTADDRKLDARRHPAELLTFLGVRPGMRVADLGAGAGYTTELLARAVGDEGVVFAQNNQYSLENFVSESWPARLARPMMKQVNRVDREFADPLPEKARELDLVTLLFAYHDIVGRGGDSESMNRRVFIALKPGGHYVVADHSAPEGVENAPSELHRIQESLVREQVEAAGFELVDEAQFLRDETDDLTSISYKVGFNTDRFLLKFRKPGLKEPATGGSQPAKAPKPAPPP